MSAWLNRGIIATDEDSHKEKKRFPDENLVKCVGEKHGPWKRPGAWVYVHNPFEDIIQYPVQGNYILEGKMVLGSHVKLRR